MNIIKDDNKFYKYESYWRSKKDKKVNDHNGKLLPYPIKKKHLYNKEIILCKLKEVEMFLRRINRYKNYKNNKDCLICGQKNITSGIFTLNNIRWEDGLQHYIDAHNTKSSDEFISKIIQFKQRYRKDNQILARVKGKIRKKNNSKYIKLDKNQILIMDALMIHGSYDKNYEDIRKHLFRYSEHAGLLDFNNNGLDKIVVSAKTTRIDKNDDDIFLPNDIEEAYDYEYIFHTHPATPKLGGRVKNGLLYEFPSLSDIFHFIEHYNEGSTQGSIVITPEGLYNIRAYDLSKKIRINENQFYRKMRDVFEDTQQEAIDIYGIKFSDKIFYTKIAQDIQYIKLINKELQKYNIYIDYYPRIKNKKGNWIIDTIYLPIIPIEK